MQRKIGVYHLSRNHVLSQEIFDLLIYAPRKFELFCSPAYNSPVPQQTYSKCPHPAVLTTHWNTVNQGERLDRSGEEGREVLAGMETEPLPSHMPVIEAIIHE